MYLLEWVAGGGTCPGTHLIRRLGSLLGIILSGLLVHFFAWASHLIKWVAGSSRQFGFVLRGIDAAQRAESIEPLFDTLGT